jgi:type II secretory pathway component GspD/PulD (secretin)
MNQISNEQTMKTLNESSVPRAWLLPALLAAFIATSPNARAQQNNFTPGAAFVYPIPEQMELGPVLDVIPCVLSDGFTINLTLVPTLTEFVGYDDPSTVLASGSLPADAVLVPTVLPRFRVRQVVSAVNVWDGQTVVLGGLLAETVTTIKDQVPVLGDLPLLGRLFRSQSKTTAKKNLLIFVTPTLIDPAGNRLHSEDEMPFAQTGIPVQPSETGGEAPKPQGAQEPMLLEKK